MNHVADRSRLNQCERRWTTRQGLECRNEPDGRFLFDGKCCALIDTKTVDNCDSRFGSVDVGFSRLNTGRDCCRAAASLCRIIACCRSGGFETAGALQGSAGVAPGLSKRAAFVTDALR